jgi:site-specific recombinase XerD
MNAKQANRAILFGNSESKLDVDKFVNFQVAKNKSFSNQFNMDMKSRITEAHLESFLRDTKNLSEYNTWNVMRAIRTLQTVWNVTEPTENAAMLLKRAMREQGRAPGSIRQYLKCMSYWAESQGNHINLSVIGLPKPESRVPRILDFETVAEIIIDPRLSLRDRTMMAVFAFSAGRLSEIQRLTVQSVNHKDKTILLKDTKTRKEKIAPIPAKYYPMLHEYLKARTEYLTSIGQSSDALFISAKTGHALSTDGIREIVYKIGRLYGLKPCDLHPHTMRFTAITRLMEVMGGNASMVKPISGHSSDKMLDYYNRVRIEAIKEKMEGFSY